MGKTELKFKNFKISIDNQAQGMSNKILVMKDFVIIQGKVKYN